LSEIKAAQSWTVPPAFHRNTGDARWFAGSLIDILADADATNGAFAFIRVRHSAKMWEPPLHYHNDTDELWYVTQGTLTIRLGDETFDAPAGTLVSAPRGVPHAFMFDVDSELLIFLLPPGVEQTFTLPSSSIPARELTMPPPGSPLPDPEEMLRIFGGFDITIIGPPLRDLIEQEAVS
jgi:mannose-6-phosphate isomerase-like protein (cupin superfamily)